MRKEITMKHSKQLPTFVRPRSADDELKLLRQKVTSLKNNPAEARAVMARAGICTVDGHLTKAFGGNA